MVKKADNNHPRRKQDHPRSFLGWNCWLQELLKKVFFTKSEGIFWDIPLMAEILHHLGCMKPYK